MLALIELFFVEILSFYVGIMYRKGRIDKKSFFYFIWCLVICYCFAIFLDPLLPFKYAPRTLESSFFINTYMLISGLIMAFLGRNIGR